MPNFNVYTSNRLEILAQYLAQIVRQPGKGFPFSTEVIIIQSRGMEKWISTALAEANGICGNCWFPFPNVFIEQTFKQVLKDVPENSLFESDTICFRIMKLLPEYLHKSGFKSLKKYLEQDTNGLKLFQLCSKISDTFDQYLIFRPEMIMKWEQEKDDHWQAKLWRGLFSENQAMHRAHLTQKFFKEIEQNASQIENLPSRISVFGISYLPPVYIEIFSQLSKIMEVNLFLMNPCMEYWADIVSDSQIMRLRRKNISKGIYSEDLHLDQGNRLLGSMGTMGKDFFSIINQLDIDVIDSFVDKTDSTILSRIQSDILNLTETSHDVEYDNDSSVQIHSCHSPMREIEVLYDNLLSMFEADPNLGPKDIIVIMPDIEKYAPFIQAVFQSQVKKNRTIPFTIADRNIQKQSLVISGFLSILDLKDSRAGVIQVMELLELSVIREKFEIDEKQIQIIWQWVENTNIKWGIDAKNRFNLGLPEYSENTWEAGIQRLLLGYAMPDKASKMFSGILAYNNIEGAEVQTLGNFLAFLESVFRCIKTLNKSQTLCEWRDTLYKIVEEFILFRDDLQMEMHNLRNIIDDLVRKSELADFNEPVCLEIVKSYLNKNFNQKSFGSGFISGGVTFCAMLPMRSIPAKVICLLGMNNDDFPRNTIATSFDFIAQSPKPGDRSKRNDDKYLFLEAIISARSIIYISFTGTNIQDNIQIPPCVVVSELIDYISEFFSIPQEKIVTYHKIQGFSVEYFKENNKLFTYSQENLEAAKHLSGPKHEPQFLSSPLPEPCYSLKHININELCYFFSNPCKFLLQHRLGIYLKESTSIPDERETFNPDGLSRYETGQKLVKQRLSGLNFKELLPVHQATGKLPHGSTGDVFFNQTGIDVQLFTGKIQKYISTDRLESLEVDFNITGFRLTGILSNIYINGQVQYRYAKITPKDILYAWILHLILCNVKKSDMQKTFLIGKDLVLEFEYFNESKTILNQLVSYFWQGMSSPLKFFPVSSYEYADQLINKNKSLESALYFARKKWQGTEYDFAPCESKDLNYSCWFGYSDPIDEEFQKIAIDVFTPIFKHIKKIII